MKPNIELIKQMTADRKWSMRSLAVRMGISHTEVSRLFSGKNIGGKKSMSGLIKVFKEVPFDQLFILD
jgi:transcriptional regulator with XRE-family HTH domain